MGQMIAVSRIHLTCSMDFSSTPSPQAAASTAFKVSRFPNGGRLLAVSFDVLHKHRLQSQWPEVVAVTALARCPRRPEIFYQLLFGLLCHVGRFVRFGFQRYTFFSVQVLLEPSVQHYCAAQRYSDTNSDAGRTLSWYSLAIVILSVSLMTYLPVSSSTYS